MQKPTQPDDKFQLVDTGKDYPSRFAMRALVAAAPDEAKIAVLLMAALNGAMPNAKIVRDDP